MKNIRSSIKALYIHIPFCDHLCDYCDFIKLQYFTIFAKPYIQKLKEELDSYKINEPLETIYIGGGTPTSLDDDLFLKLLEMVDPYTKEVKEYTIEANPESLSDSKLKMMKNHGVNRLSIGVESTDNDLLKGINRHHTYQDVVSAVNRAKTFGFTNINVDLILGIPQQNKEKLKLDLKRLVALDVEHISCYSLTVHPNTLFFLKGVNEPDDDLSRSYYDLVNDYLKDKGYIHYEVSNWAKPSFESKHNKVYWRNERYFGVGLSASGYIDNYRYTNTKSITKYLKGMFLGEKEEVSLMDEREYQIMLNLRTNEGINLEYFKERFNEDLLKTRGEVIEKYLKNGELYIENNHLIASYQGMMVLDQIILCLI